MTEQCSSLAVIERELLEAELDELSGCAESGNRNERQGTTDEDELGARRELVRQSSEQLRRIRVAEMVCIVDHEQAAVGRGDGTADARGFFVERA
jgi:hypothetical protein